MTGPSLGTRGHSATPAAAAAMALMLLAPGPARAGIEEGRAKAEVCVSCHGAAGNATLAGIPSLSAQPRQFLVSALFQFREGKRASPVMTPLAANLTNTDLNDLAAYFSAQPANPGAPAAPAIIEAGRRLAADNNCVACHAANRLDQQPIPRLAGQQADYLREQLKAFKASVRADPDGTMTSAAQAWSADHIETLATYLAGLPAAR